MKEAWSTICMGCLSLLLAASVSAWMTAGLSPSRLTTAQISPSRVALQAQEQGIEVVDVATMRGMVESGSHLILDARSQSEYDEGHIPTAMSLSVKDFENSFPLIAPMLMPETPLVVYCSGALCDDALLLIGYLREAGFGNASLFLEGMEGWE